MVGRGTRIEYDTLQPPHLLSSGLDAGLDNRVNSTLRRGRWLSYALTREFSGLVAYSVRGKDFAANDNGDGVDGEVVSLKRATVNGNGNYGVLALRKAALLDSTVTGSGHFDIGSFYRPRVVNTTCGTSVMILTPGSGGSTGDSWGVCAGD